MEQSVSEQNGWVIVSLAGEVDLDRSPAVRKLLLESVARDRDLLVDLAQVSYIDSSGVASLIEALQATKKSGRRFGLAAVGTRVLRVLQIARLDKVFTLHDSVEAGLTQDG